MDTENVRYMLRSLPSHLALAGKAEALERILTDFAFLESKTDIAPIQDLLSDYALTEQVLYPAETQHAFALIREALRLSAHTINQDANQLAAQLFGRLMSFDEEIIRVLLRSIPYPATRGVRIYPSTASLIPPTGPLHHTLNCHQKAVTCMLYLEASHSLLTASEDGNIRVWDLVQGTKLPFGMEHTAPILSVALFPDQQRIAFVAEDQTLRVWNLDTREHSVICDNTGMAKSVGVFPDGIHIAFGETVAPYSVRVWNVNTKCEVTHLGSHQDSVSALICLQNGDLISATESGELKHWNMISGLVEREQSTRGRVRSMALNRAESILLVAADTGLYCWTLQSDTLQQESEGLTTFGFGAVAFSNQKDMHVAAGFDGSLVVWHETINREPTFIPGTRNYISTLLITPNEHWLVAGDDNGKVKVWDLTRIHETSTPHGHRTQAHLVRIAPSETIGVSTGGMWYDIKSMYNLKLWNFKSEWLEKTIPAHRDAITDVAFSADSRWLVSVAKDKTAKIWDLSDPTKPIVLEHQVSLNTVALVAPNIVITGGGATPTSDRYDLSIWSLDGKYQFGMNGHTGPVTGVVVVGDGSHILSASDDGSLRLWNMARRVSVAEGYSAEGKIKKVVLTPDHKWAVSMSEKDSAEIWALPSLELVGQLTKHPATLVDILAVENDLIVTITGAVDHTLRLWRLSTAQCLYELRSGSYFTSLTATPFQHQFLYMGGDDAITLWDAYHRETVARFVGESPVLSGAISRTGRRLIIGEVSGGIHLLELTGLPDNTS